MPPKFLAPAFAVALAFALSGCERSAPESAPDAPEPVSAPPPVVEAPPPAPVPLRPRTPWKPAPLLVPSGARDALLLQATEAEKREHWFGNDPLGALDLYTALATAEPPMPEAQIGRDRVIDLLAARFEDECRSGRLDEAARIAGVLDVVRPEATAPRQALLRDAEQAAAEVSRGRERQAAGQWLAPRGESAVAAYRSALAQVPGFEPALAGLAEIEQQLLERAAAAAEQRDYDAAEADLRRAARVDARPSVVQDARAALAQSRTDHAKAALDAAVVALDRLDLPTAAQRLGEAKDADPQAPGIDELSQRLTRARRYGHFQPGQVFSDALAEGGEGPAMIVIPHGTFTMGAGDGEPGARDNEGPRHDVRFERGFALAAHETTVQQFARFVAATGYRTVAEQRGRSSVYDERGGAMVELRGAHWRRSYLGRTAAATGEPVIHIAFEDAVAYADWLSARTGQRYRLPSEAEFEYVLRGGETGPWPWGASAPPSALGNLTGEGDQSPQGRRWGRAIRGWSDGHWGPAPVGTYRPEAFGTRDVIGNVSEWVEDCWHDSYRRAPGDGRAWVNPGCDERVVRGGSWASTAEQARSAFRLQVPAALTSARIGFRVARDL